MTVTANGPDRYTIADDHADEIAKSAAAGDVVLVYGPPRYLANAYDAVLARLAPERFIRASRVAARQYLHLADGGQVIFRWGDGVRGISAHLVHLWPGADPEGHDERYLIDFTGARLLTTDHTTQPTTQGDPA